MTAPTVEWPRPITGGWRVRETGRYFVDVLVMAYGNTRIAITPKDDESGYDRGWCYHEEPWHTVLRCLTFDPDSGGEPVGWIKEAGTERRACAGYYPPGPHREHVPECPDCGRER